MPVGARTTTRSRLSRAAVAGTALLLAVALPFACASAAQAAPARPGSSAFDNMPLNQISVSGLHNAYDPAKGSSILGGLDKGAHFLEIDVYTTYGGEHGWIVSHADPLFNSNNCRYTVGSGIFRSTFENGDLSRCLDDLRGWSDSHPGHDPIYLKFEMKWGFRSNAGMGPAQLDHLIAEHLGANNVFTPADMLGTTYSTPDQAAKAGAWPAWNQLRGKFILYPITGTIENVLAGYSLDNLSTEQEYAEYVAGLAASGSLGQAMMWPAMTDPAAGGDPRDKYDAALRPWFVLFDDQAGTWLNGQYALSWYCANHYLTVETAAESVAPALDETNPDPTAAAQRVQYLAEQGHSSATTFDWLNAPGAFALWPRNC